MMNSVDPDENGGNEDSKVQLRDSARTKDGNVVDITNSDNNSKDILDITDTPDVAVWNKSVQKKNSMENHLKEREYGEAQTIGIGLRKKQHNNDDDLKDSTI